MAGVDDELYRVVVECDQRYDGRVYVGIRTTGIVCFPSCRSRTPKRSNIEVFSSYADARRAGFRPCKRCRPDQAAGVSPDVELALRADDFIVNRLPRRVPIAEAAEALFVSPRHLTRTLNRVWGMGYVKRRRHCWQKAAEEALGLLCASSAQAAARMGMTPDQFCRAYRRVSGKSPELFLQEVREAVRHGEGRDAMGR